MTRQQRDLPGNHAELRPPSAAGRVLRVGAGNGQSAKDLLGRAAEVHLDRFARLVVENQDGATTNVGCRGFQGDGSQCSRSDAPRAREGRTPWLISRFHLHVPQTE